MNNVLKPSGAEFAKLFQKNFSDELPLLTAKQMDSNQSLYAAMLSFFGYVQGILKGTSQTDQDNLNDPESAKYLSQTIARYQTSPSMVALKTDSNNGSARQNVYQIAKTLMHNIFSSDDIASANDVIITELRNEEKQN